MNIETCLRVQCGALSQQEAGLDTLLECSQAGLVGVKGCGHPDCVPYEEEMRLRGVCPPGHHVPTVSAVPAATTPPALPIVTATLPSITPRHPTPAPPQLVGEPWYCPVNRWVKANTFAAVVVLAGIYIAITRWRGV